MWIRLGAGVLVTAALLCAQGTTSGVMAFTTSGGGYTMIDSEEPGGPAYAWDDISATGTVINWINWDTESHTIPLPFNFTFYGVTYSAVNVCTNGFLQFNGGDTDGVNGAIPDPLTPNNIVAAFWDDLYDINATAETRYDTLGAAPNRRFVVSWIRLTRVGFTTDGYVEDDQYTFQATLLEGTNEIRLQYGPMSNGSRANPPYAGGESATVGIEDATGANGLQYLKDGAPTSNQVYNGLAILFTPNGGSGGGGGGSGGGASGDSGGARHKRGCFGAVTGDGSLVALALVLAALLACCARR